MGSERLSVTPCNKWLTPGDVQKQDL